MSERIVIVDGIRTPFCKAGTVFKDISADDLGAFAVKEIMARTHLDAALIDELIIGNVSQPANAANIARVIALKAGLPNSLIAHTVHRNCASGMEAVSTGIDKILAGNAQIIVAGGTESMSNIPLLYNAKMTGLFAQLMKAKTVWQKLAALSRFRLSYLKPIIGIQEGLTDPVCGLNMGQTAEVLAKEFHILRDEQDRFALSSHQKAVHSMNNKIFAQEIIPIPIPPANKAMQIDDNGPRADQTLQALAKLKPFFDRYYGTVTVGNACPVTDGAAALVLMRESKAREMGYTPLGAIRAYAYAGLEPERMGLGPVYATSKLLQQTGIHFSDFDLIEINEAFSVQVLACERAFASDTFAQRYLGREHAVGAIDPEKLNVNGGAVALGHPVGSTGTRLLITLLKELRRRNKSLGLASLCIGGGQGAAFAVEVLS